MERLVQTKEDPRPRSARPSLAARPCGSCFFFCTSLERLFMKKSCLGPLSLGLVALALGCSSNDGSQPPATSNGDTSVAGTLNMGGGTGTTSGLQPPLPVVENPDHE